MLKVKIVKTNRIKNEKGMAILEMIPLLVIFIVLFSYGLGLWGAIHTAVLNSIAARTYAFETFRQRVDLTYLRENTSAAADPVFPLERAQIRYHAIADVGVTSNENFKVTKRDIAFGRPVEVQETNAGQEVHTQRIFTLQGRNQGRAEISPIWIMVGYGICLNSACGGDL